MKFKVLTINTNMSFKKGNGLIYFEGIADNNDYYEYWEDRGLSIHVGFYSLKIYNDIYRAYKRNNDDYFLRDVEIEDRVLQLLQSKDKEVVKLAAHILLEKAKK